MTAMIKPPDTTAERIYALYEQDAETRDERPYLGASMLGSECWRFLWYTFRWAYHAEPLQGRVLRLFEDGNREETRVVDELRRIGVYVFGQQSGFSAFGGHLQGHIDGVATTVPEAPKTAHILEIKTHNDKSFKDLLKQGVKKSKPQHYAQMQLYMHYLDYTRALYIAVNKNDSMLHVERISYDKKEAYALTTRAEVIINSNDAPPKLHEDQFKPNAYACQWCSAKSVCHDTAFARRNCRTCLSSTAVVDDTNEAKWHCSAWNKNLTLKEQHVGCYRHRYLPAMVDGRQIDADNLTITYRMRDGGYIWVDQGMEVAP